MPLKMVRISAQRDGTFMQDLIIRHLCSWNSNGKGHWIKNRSDCEWF